VKKNVRTFLVALMVFAMVAVVVAGCSPAAPTTSTATTAKPKLKTAMVTDVGGLGDKSFNDLSYEGLKRANKDFGVEIKVLESKEQADYERNLTNLANAGYSPIFAVGFLMTDAVSKVSTAFPKTQFGGIDEAFDKAPSNVAGLVFKEQEASYLAGVLAGLAVKDTTIDPRIKNNNTIGFVGGFDVPVIERFRAGFVQGVQSVNPDAKVIAVYAGSFNDQAKGRPPRRRARSSSVSTRTSSSRSRMPLTASSLPSSSASTRLSTRRSRTSSTASSPAAPTRRSV
jgi:basic membrane protein A